MHLLIPYNILFCSCYRKISIAVIAAIAFFGGPYASSAHYGFKIKSNYMFKSTGVEDSMATYLNLKLPVLPAQIDIFDTVYFNIPEGAINGTIIDIPVSISSNDSIYALDFSFKYNSSDLVLDSIINYTPGLQYLYHYNTTDSVFRFTSNRLTPIPNDSTILHIRFITLVGQLCAPDIDSAITYLNGEVSSNSITGCLVTALQNIDEGEIEALVFPNPATNDFFISEKFSGIFEQITIYDRTGRIVKIYSGAETTRFNIDSLQSGLYIVAFSNSATGHIRKEKLIKL